MNSFTGTFLETAAAFAPELADSTAAAVSVKTAPLLGFSAMTVSSDSALVPKARVLQDGPQKLRFFV